MCKNLDSFLYYITRCDVDKKQQLKTKLTAAVRQGMSMLKNSCSRSITSCTNQRQISYAKRLMFQNLVGSLVRSLLSMDSMVFISSSSNLKSKMSRFCFSLSSLSDLGMTLVFRWTPHRKAIWAGVLWYFLASPCEDQIETVTAVKNRTICGYLVAEVLCETSTRWLKTEQ